MAWTASRCAQYTSMPEAKGFVRRSWPDDHAPSTEGRPAPNRFIEPRTDQCQHQAAGRRLSPPWKTGRILTAPKQYENCCTSWMRDIQWGPRISRQLW